MQIITQNDNIRSTSALSKANWITTGDRAIVHELGREQARRRETQNQSSRPLSALMARDPWIILQRTVYRNAHHLYTLT